MKTKEYKTRKQLEDAIFYQLTRNPSFEDDKWVSSEESYCEEPYMCCTYYLHGNEETGEIYSTSCERNQPFTPGDVLFTSDFKMYLEKEPSEYDFEHMNNPIFWENENNEDFMDVVRDLADQWEEEYKNN